MGRKSLVFEFLATLLIGLAIGYFALPRTDVLRLQQEAHELKTQLAEKEDEVISLQSQITDLEQQSRNEILGVYFSPRGGCEDQVIYWMNRANKSVHVLIYIFTLDSVGDALINASNRGIEVKVVFEKKEIDRYSEYQRLKNSGIGIRNDTNSDEMHNKVMIVDGIIVLTGSFNWSRNAEENNDENLIIIRSSYVAGIYERLFQEIWEKASEAGLRWKMNTEERKRSLEY